MKSQVTQINRSTGSRVDKSRSVEVDAGDGVSGYKNLSLQNTIKLITNLDYLLCSVSYAFYYHDTSCKASECR